MALAATLTPAFSPADTTVLDRVRALADDRLRQQVEAIDKGAYPGDFLHDLGRAGGFALHAEQGTSLMPAIESMAVISETCLSTGFMAWCQNTLGWYLLNTDNEQARSRHLSKVLSGEQLGGTGLSNPMKCYFGIEKFRLKGERVGGGYVVKGLLPWVSNLGPDHLFGGIFEVENGGTVMALIDCANPAVTLKPCEPFLAMDGTGTYAVMVRDLFVPDALILADPAPPYVKKMRAGFILLQVGMAAGLVRDCIAMMEEVRPSLGHVNRYLDVQPEQIAETLADLEEETSLLAADPYETDPDYWRRVIALRLAGGEAVTLAAHNAMLHCGARGYVASHRAHRRLRESYFVAIVTPATKQLRKMLADLDAQAA